MAGTTSIAAPADALPFTTVNATFACQNTTCDAEIWLPQGVTKPPVIVMAHGFGALSFLLSLIGYNGVVFTWSLIKSRISFVDFMTGPNWLQDLIRPKLATNSGYIRRCSLLRTTPTRNQSGRRRGILRQQRFHFAPHALQLPLYAPLQADRKSVV